MQFCPLSGVHLGTGLTQLNLGHSSQLDTGSICFSTLHSLGAGQLGHEDGHLDRLGHFGLHKAVSQVILQPSFCCPGIMLHSEFAPLQSRPKLN